MHNGVMCVGIVITAFADIENSASIQDVGHIPETKHGSSRGAKLDTARASVLRVCVVLSPMSTWGLTCVPEASPVLGAKTDTQNGINGRAPHRYGKIMLRLERDENVMQNYVVRGLFKRVLCTPPQFA